MSEADRKTKWKWPRRAAIGFGAALVVVSLVANVVLYRVARSEFANVQAVRLDPAGSRYKFRDPAKAGAVVFFGDSRAAEWPAPAGVDVVNRGIGRQTTAQCVLRFDEHVAPLRPRVVVIQMGVNDLKAIAMFPERERQILDDAKRNIADVIARSRDLGARVIVTTVFPPSDVPREQRGAWTGRVDAAVGEVNEFIRRLGTKDVIVFDSFALLEDPAKKGRIRSEYARDFLHVNEAGYQKLNEGLAPLLK